MARHSKGFSRETRADKPPPKDCANLRSSSVPDTFFYARGPKSGAKLRNAMGASMSKGADRAL
jgi:hypothetical protein